MGVTRINQLADNERARFNEWAERWVAIGLRTGPADRPKFERAVQDCYRFAGIPWPGVVVWVPSPLTLAFAAPTAALIIQAIRATRADRVSSGGTEIKISNDQWKAAVDSAVGSAVRSAVDSAVDSAVRSAVDSAVRSVVRSAVGSAVRSVVRSAVRSAVDSAVDSAVGSAVGSAVDSAVDSAVRSAVGSAVRSAVDSAVRSAVRSVWMDSCYVPGQFGVGWGWSWYYGTAYTSFFREVCGLELPGDLWERGRAYEATTESACWWWPCRDFVMVSERPSVIHREEATRGQWRLHCETGPAVAWPDGWGVYVWHGTRVPPAVIDAPHTLTIQQIRDESNQEIRRVMLTRFGEDRFIRDGGAREVHHDEFGVLYDLGADTLAVRVINNTTEPDGSTKPYWLYVHPQLRPMRQEEGSANMQLGDSQPLTARNAVASTFGLRGDEYSPEFES